MSILKTAVVLPLLAAPGTFSVEPAAVRSAVRSTEVRSASSSPLKEEVMIRQLRIERILMTLDQLATIAVHMPPERAATLEPVLVELADQTMELTTEKAVVSVKTDSALEKIEATLERLGSALERLVEPEMSL